MTIRDIIAAQSAAIETEAFQGAIVEGMTRALLRDAAPLCLLRAPTGSGKTFIYLANAEAQRGFEAAVQASQAVKSQLEGQTEKLLVRQTESGAVVYTNRATSQPPLDYGVPLPQSSDLPVREPVTQPAYGMQQSLFENFFGADNPANALDEVLAAPAQVRKKPHEQPDTAAELLELLNSKGIRAYPLHKNIRNLPRALQREQHPQMQEMTKVSEAVAMRLPIPEDLKRNAVRAALNRLKEKEMHTELTQGARHEEEVLMITDRGALAREAIGILSNLPQVEDEDMRIIIEVLGSRLRRLIEEAFEYREDRPSDIGLRRLSRDAAYWVIRREAQNITELMQSLVAEFTTLEAAAPLPDWMVFPAALSLAASSRNIYGVMPPSENDLAKLEAIADGG